MKIGDRVRFLDAQGGGIVKGFNSNGLVMVEDEDGFEIPTMASQCVVVSQEDDDRQAGHAPVHQAPLTRAQKAAREAMTEVDKLKEENGQLKARIHELENEMNNLKLQLLKAQAPSSRSRARAEFIRPSRPIPTRCCATASSKSICTSINSSIVRPA